MHNFLTLTLSPQVPVSFHGYPSSYNIPSRLWTNAFHRILEHLRRVSLTSSLALEHLSDLIYYAYNFYAGLLENPILDTFKSYWLEALGDLARYRMAVASHPASPPVSGRDNGKPQVLFPSTDGTEARIDDSPSPSVGPGAALALDVEPERETWRKTARGWYARGLKDTPGLGRLHHHLAIISREGDGEEMRAVYHFVKRSVIAVFSACMVFNVGFLSTA
jgi:protein SMG6